MPMRIFTLLLTALASVMCGCVMASYQQPGITENSQAVIKGSHTEQLFSSLDIYFRLVESDTKDLTSDIKTAEVIPGRHCIRAYYDRYKHKLVVSPILCFDTRGNHTYLIKTKSIDSRECGSIPDCLQFSIIDKTDGTVVAGPLPDSPVD